MLLPISYSYLVTWRYNQKCMKLYAKPIIGRRVHHTKLSLFDFAKSRAQLNIFISMHSPGLARLAVEPQLPCGALTK